MGKSSRNLTVERSKSTATATQFNAVDALLDRDQEREACARLLIVHENPSQIGELESLLQRSGFQNVASTTEWSQVSEVVRKRRPDLLLLELKAATADTMAVLHSLRRSESEEYVPILLLGTAEKRGLAHDLIAAGANDFLAQPVSEIDLRVRIKNLLQFRFHANALREQIQIRTVEMKIAQLETVQRLAIAAEYRDDQTGMHARRVGQLSGRIAEKINCSLNFVQLISEAAALHDVGKIGIPDSILLKKGRLTTEEFDLIKTHTGIGARILSGSSSPLLQLAEQIALTHHERWDGLGYSGLKGVEIPLAGRIVAIADTYDALTKDRPYRQASSRAEALLEIEREKGAHFDPQLVEAFLALDF